MNMPIVAMVTGMVLVGIGLAGYGLSDAPSKTALIPAFFGMPVIICGALALKERFLKHAMHVAAVLGVLGFLAPLGRIIPTAVRGEFRLDLGGICLIGMAVVCGVFVLLCVKSFIDVRKAREAGQE